MRIEGGREGGVGSEYAEEQKNERLGLGLDYKGYIYRRGIFVIYSTGFYPGRVSGRVLDFF